MNIRVITEPSVYVISRQSVDEAELGRHLSDSGFEAWTTDAPSPGEKVVEIAGRECYQSFAKPRPGGNKVYIDHILEVGHGSVLEHAVWGLIFTGVSRSCTHEIVRHRAGFGFSQLSQRYVDESDVAFVLPPSLLPECAVYEEFSSSAIGLASMSGDEKRQYQAFAAWRQAANEAIDAYGSLERYLTLKWINAHFPQDGVRTPDAAGLWLRRHKEQATSCRKAAREAARSVLPNCAETKIFVSGNGRAWRNFIEQRGAPGADAEIRRLAVAVATVMKIEAPNLFGDVEVGADTVTSRHPKV